MNGEILQIKSREINSKSSKQSLFRVSWYCFVCFLPLDDFWFRSNQAVQHGDLLGIGSGVSLKPFLNVCWVFHPICLK